MERILRGHRWQPRYRRRALQPAEGLEEGVEFEEVEAAAAPLDEAGVGCDGLADGGAVCACDYAHRLRHFAPRDRRHHVRIGSRLYGGPFAAHAIFPGVADARQ